MTSHTTSRRWVRSRLVSVPSFILGAGITANFAVVLAVEGFNPLWALGLLPVWFVLLAALLYSVSSVGRR